MIKLEINDNKVNIDFWTCNEQELKAYFWWIWESIVLLSEVNESEDKQWDCESLLAMIKYAMYKKLRDKWYIDEDTISLWELM